MVFADTNKLAPYVHALIGIESDKYNRQKRADAIEGFAEAPRNAATCVIPGPSENPLALALALVHCSAGMDAPLAFTDGLTRTALMIELGAAFVPLQAESEIDANKLHALFGGKRWPEPIEKVIDTTPEPDSPASCRFRHAPGG